MGKKVKFVVLVLIFGCCHLQVQSATPRHEEAITNPAAVTGRPLTRSQKLQAERERSSNAAAAAAAAAASSTSDSWTAVDAVSKPSSRLHTELKDRHPLTSTQHHNYHHKNEARSITIDKGPPELQFGLSFTIPFISLQTERLLNWLSGKHYGNDPYGEVASLLKLNVGGLVLTAVVGVLALFFVPALFPGKLPGLLANKIPHGFMPHILDSLFPGSGGGGLFGGGGHGGYGQHDYNGYPGGHFDEYPQYKYEEGDHHQKRSRGLNEGPSNGTDFGQYFSHLIKRQIGNAHKCARYVACTEGKRAKESPHRNGTTSDGRGGRSEDEDGPTALESVLNVVNSVSPGVKKAPMVQELQKAFNDGKNGVDCSKKYEELCPIAPSKISSLIQDAGNFVFNS